MKQVDQPLQKIYYQVEQLKQLLQFLDNPIRAQQKFIAITVAKATEKLRTLAEIFPIVETIDKEFS
ncbi:MAG: hypothetical protein NHB32_21890 [Fischerella sp. CENA71]|nr:hypothetical protein [Fischerella sp. CENA71]